MKTTKLRKLLIKQVFLSIAVVDEEIRSGFYDHDEDKFRDEIIKIERTINKINKL